MKIAICGEVYSPNLGDGVIAHSLAWLFNYVNSKADISFLDFEARTNYNISSDIISSSSNVFRVFHRKFSNFSSYRKIMFALRWYLYKRKKLNAFWRKEIIDTDLVVIGGGQLLMDNDLVFPFKIHQLVATAANLDKSIVFYGCGVGSHWSSYGLSLIRSALLNKNVQGIYLRDYGSCCALKKICPEIRSKIHLTIDPALFASEAFKIASPKQSYVIGLGLASPMVLQRHSFEDKKYLHKEVVKQFWIDLVSYLRARHNKVIFFTNGAIEDQKFAQEVISNINENERFSATLLPRPLKPETLVDYISNCNAIVAHRLHANIIAYSLDKPFVALGWDKKVLDFGKMVGLSEFFVEPSNLNSELVYERLERGIVSEKDITIKDELKKMSIQYISNILGNC